MIIQKKVEGKTKRPLPTPTVVTSLQKKEEQNEIEFTDVVLVFANFFCSLFDVSPQFLP